MKRMTVNILAGTLLSAGSAALAVAAYRRKVQNSHKVLDDTDIRNSEKIDKMESVDADKEREEQGLTQYDSTLRSEWIANGFPQTHLDPEELERLEQQKN
ncbi:hypothetical protein GJU40_15075 [Bacillus lacus]|uniref:Uncharacterized protein n=1 Tax=Metabacillus lacus TaxID=1983721 RepID=A0A7X2J158_9BACI|nr:hypothetical protein [Metabacillus lacus]MRX73465.1 hypothetical protein [Metabacillus lacus]